MKFIRFNLKCEMKVVMLPKMFTSKDVWDIRSRAMSSRTLIVRLRTTYLIQTGSKNLLSGWEVMSAMFRPLIDTDDGISFIGKRCLYRALPMTITHKFRPAVSLCVHCVLHSAIEIGNWRKLKTKRLLASNAVTQTSLGKQKLPTPSI